MQKDHMVWRMKKRGVQGSIKHVDVLGKTFRLAQEKHERKRWNEEDRERENMVSTIYT